MHGGVPSGNSRLSRHFSGSLLAAMAGKAPTESKADDNNTEWLGRILEVDNLLPPILSYCTMVELMGFNAVSVAGTRAAA